MQGEAAIAAPFESHQSAAAASAVALGDFNQRWSEALNWLDNLRQLVESPTDYTALKFASCLEAEQQLFRRLPQLRAVCKEARRLWSSQPQLSPHVADRMAQLQAAWLAVESLLAAELKLHKGGLLAALSGDLKQLATRQLNKQLSSADWIAQNESQSSTLKTDNQMGGTTQAKGESSTLQQVLSVTQSVSKLLDWISTSDCLRPVRQRSTASASVLSARVEAEYSVGSSSATPSSYQPAPRSVSTGASTTTTYRRSTTVTDGDQADRTSSQSSEVLIYAGGNNSIGNGLLLVRYRDRRAASFDAAAVRQTDNHNAMIANSSSSPADESGLCNAVDDDSRTTCDSDDFHLPTDRASAHADQLDVRMSPQLQTVADRVASLKASASIAQAGLLSCCSAAGAADQSQLSCTATALGELQRQTDSLKATVTDLSVASAQDEIFRQAYLENLTLLNKWIDTLHER